MKILILFMVSFGSLLANNAQEIVNKALNVAYYQGKHYKSHSKLLIVDSLKRERIREASILRSNTENGNQKYYVYFKKPKEMKKMVFMAWKNLDKADDRWLYLPALDLVKRIAASDDRTSFVGSNFYYEDVSGRGATEDTHMLIDETEVFYIIKSTPKNKESVEFSYFKSYIDKDTFLPIKIDYFNDKEKLYRTFEIKQTQIVQGYLSITKTRMTDVSSGAYSVATYDSIEYLDSLKSKIYTERYLRKPPKKYLK